MWDLSVLNSEGDILFEDFDYETQDEAENAAMEFIKNEKIEDYVLDISQPEDIM